MNVPSMRANGRSARLVFGKSLLVVLVSNQRAEWLNKCLSSFKMEEPKNWVLKPACWSLPVLRLSQHPKRRPGRSPILWSAQRPNLRTCGSAPILGESCNRIPVRRAPANRVGPEAPVVGFSGDRELGRTPVFRLAIARKIRATYLGDLRSRISGGSEGKDQDRDKENQQPSLHHGVLRKTDGAWKVPATRRTRQ